MSDSDLRFKRILLKLSGEVLGGDSGEGFDFDTISILAKQIKDVHDLGIDVGLVVGGGNIFRGVSSAPPGMDRASADHMGILGTIINAICLQDQLEKVGLETRVLTALEIKAIAEPYIKRRAVRHLEKGRVLIFAAGTGHPFFSTDTAAALRCTEIGADVLVKGTKVDGVYNKDPALHTDAVRYTRLNYQQVLREELRIMDATAIALCMENSVPILVLNIRQEGALLQAMKDISVGTLVS